MTWKCFFGFHKWTKWELTIAEYIGTNGDKYQRQVQMRTCSICGYVEVIKL